MTDTATDNTPNAFADAVRASDHGALVAAFADDVELYTPAMADPFTGIDQVGPLFGILLAVFEDIEITLEAEIPDGFVFSFRARVGGEPIEIVDRLTFASDGRIQTIVVTARPVAGIEALGEAVAARLAEL